MGNIGLSVTGRGYPSGPTRGVTISVLIMNQLNLNLGLIFCIYTLTFGQTKFDLNYVVPTL